MGWRELRIEERKLASSSHGKSFITRGAANTRTLLAVIVVLLACTCTLALAGPNAGGTIFMHYEPMGVPQDPVYLDGGLTILGDAVNQAPPDRPVMMFAYAAFDPGCGHPRIAGVAFACLFNPEVTGYL
jgi:hypothetical protein